MNIKIITIHAMHNPGSVFQCYALQNYLESIGCNVQIINYLPKYLFDEGSPILYIIKQLLYYKTIKIRAKKFDDFIKKELHISTPYYSFKEIVEAHLVSDLFLTGSDQLWNGDFPCGKDPSFYLEFTDNPNKAAFSTSVGKAIVDNDHLSYLTKKLGAFKYISVRERSTADTLSEKLSRNVYWVCDPVFLLSANDYNRFINDENPYGDYVLVYMAPSSSILDRIVAYFKHKGYSILLCGGVTKRCVCDVHIKDCGPKDFLNLISKAKYVVSTSFHATSFCHIFHVPFITILPEGNNERILSLVNYTGLESQVIDKSNDSVDLNDLVKSIDWYKVDKKLYSFINKSKVYLSTVLKGCECKKSNNDE